MLVTLVMVTIAKSLILLPVEVVNIPIPGRNISCVPVALAGVAIFNNSAPEVLFRFNLILPPLPLAR